MGVRRSFLRPRSGLSLGSTSSKSRNSNPLLTSSFFFFQMIEGLAMFKMLLKGSKEEKLNLNCIRIMKVRNVQPHDPQVQDAANHAVKSLQPKSNLLFPYELQEIVAKAEVIEDHVKFNMLLKLKRGDKEEKYKVKVHKNNEGA